MLPYRRVFLWFQSISEKKKIKVIKEQASQLKTTGFCFTGRPGIIVVEGESLNIQAFCRTMRSTETKFSMESKHIEEFEKESDARLFADFDITLASNGKKSDLAKVKEILKAAGLEKHFKALISPP